MSTAPLRVAIVGAGPAGLYAATELLKRDDRAKVDLYERLPTPGGLARAGVSPDHAVRREVIEVYERLAMASGRYRFRGNVEIGRHLSPAELGAAYHAVIYASGAASDRRLGIPGEDLPGSHAATDFVAWYNAHPDAADRTFDLGGERAVVIGNGNVALDVARMLLLGPERLARTDVADHALQALRGSRVREVVILGRRGAAQAAFTAPELMELDLLDDIDVVVESAGDLATADLDFNRTLRMQRIGEYARRAAMGRPKRLVLRFLHSPVAIVGDDRVRGLRVVENRLLRREDGQWRAEPGDTVAEIATHLVFRAVGYRGAPIEGLPFDERRGVVPNERGRVSPGCYVTGWIKRGPSGVIGSNKVCAQETVRALLEDFRAARLDAPQHSPQQLERRLRERQPEVVDYRGWKAIDASERAAGLEQQRPRVRYSTVERMLRATRPAQNAS